MIKHERERALEMALQTATPGEPWTSIIQRAMDYLRFLSAAPPAATQKPKADEPAD